MKFHIGEKFRITSERYCWHVQTFRGVYDQPGPKFGLAQYKTITYHTTLEDAVGSLAQLMLRELDTHTVAEALAGLRRIVEEIAAAFPDCEVVTIKVSVPATADPSPPVS